MSEFAPPKYVSDIISCLNILGHAAYPVGGCVRDLLLGRRPNDWDVCTAALPEQVLEAFPGALTIGIKHGTVAVRSGKKLVEVTTFRTETGYSDHRSPDSVSFISDLYGDLARRDFTVNAMALDADGSVIDPFGGRDDLRRGIIRCVGNPDDRLSEDALRMLRALRFAAQLGFGIDPDTLGAIYENAHLALLLSAERVRDELQKILISPSPELIVTAVNSGLLSGYISPGLSSAPAALRHIPRQPRLRWCALCAWLKSSGAVSDISGLLTALRLDSASVRTCSSGAEAALSGYPEDPAAWKKLASRLGSETAECAAAACQVLCGKNALSRFRAALSSGECFSLDTLALRGSDLSAAGFSGKDIGYALNAALDHVIEHPEDNDADTLMRFVKSIFSVR